MCNRFASGKSEPRSENSKRDLYIHEVVILTIIKKKMNLSVAVETITEHKCVST